MSLAAIVKQQSAFPPLNDMNVEPHNSRASSLNAADADKIKQTLSKAVLKISAHASKEDVVKTSIAYLLINYARFRLQENNSKIIAHIVMKLGAPNALVNELINLEYYLDSSCIGYAIDHIFQDYLDDTIDWAEETTKRRKVLGAYYTPYPIASYICKKTIPFSNTHRAVLDPACGTGVFLSAAGHHLYEQGISTKKIMSLLHGWDKNRFALNIAELLIALEFCAVKESALSEVPENNFLKTDSLLEENPNNDLIHTSSDSHTKYGYIVTNPPYDRLKPDGLSRAAKERVMEYASQIKTSGFYPLSTSGSLELYRLFLEKIISIAQRHKSCVGLIIPKSFAGDKNALKLRSFLVRENLISGAIFIPEKARAFAGVTQAFLILNVDTNKKDTGVEIGSCKTISELHNTKTSLNCAHDISRSFPQEFNIMDLPPEGYSLIKHLNSFPTIKETDWIKNKRGEVDLTLYKELLERGEKKLLRGKGVKEYEVKSFDLIDYNELMNRMGSSQKKDDIKKYRLACQQISNMDAKKRLKFTLIEPNTALGNSLNYLCCDGHENKYLLLGTLAVMNSVLLDWRFRITSSNNHVNNYEIDLLPFYNKKDSLIDIGHIVEENLSRINSPNVRKSIELKIIELFSAEKYVSFLSENHPSGHLLAGGSIER